MRKSVIDMIRTGKNIQSVIEKSSLSVKEMLRIIHTQSKTMQKWFAGESMPSTRQIFAIAWIGQCKVEDIVVLKKAEL